jgi:hypothetical protein
MYIYTYNVYTCTSNRRCIIIFPERLIDCEQGTTIAIKTIETVYRLLSPVRIQRCDHDTHTYMAIHIGVTAESNWKSVVGMVS